MAATIYLHWTATGYDWIRPGHYHRIIARSWGWTAADITIQSVMTHAEAASNRDGRWMHDTTDR